MTAHQQITPAPFDLSAAHMEAQSVTDACAKLIAAGDRLGQAIARRSTPEHQSAVTADRARCAANAAAFWAAREKSHEAH